MKLAQPTHTSPMVKEGQHHALPYWPYCTQCKAPFDFDDDEPFAHCECGTTEWGHPRPASFVEVPTKLKRN